MTKNELNKLIACYIVAVGVDGVPNSHLWLAIDSQMSNLERHQIVLAFLKDVDLVSENNHFCTLTRKGLEMHNQIVALYQPAQ